jgi:HAD superfamily hydrolase (TIGR01484 family)
LIDTAIILAGGLGTRLRPLTNETPKPLLPIKGRPMIQHMIENMKKHGIDNIILSVGFRADKIKEYFKDGSNFDVNISYSIEETPLGTGGAIKQAAQGLDKPFFLAWGDNLHDVDFNEMYKTYLRDAPQVIMTLVPREDVENFGVAKLEDNKIVTFVEKPKREDAPTNLINAGAFIVDPHCLAILPEGKSSIEKDCFEKLAPLGEISAYVHEGQWFPTDTIEKYELTLEKFRPIIDFRNKNFIVADVDDTICESCQEISPEMVSEIHRLMDSGHEFAFISGTKVKSLQRMISAKLMREHHLLGNTGTNYTFIGEDNSAEMIYNYSLEEEEKSEIISALNNLIREYDIQSMTTKDDQIQDRDSQITLSAIGRHAPRDFKENFDPSDVKRKEWVGFLRKSLSEDKYAIRIGGTTSIDIVRKGLDKEWGIRNFCKQKNISLSEVVFFGDKLYPGGNDFPATRIVDCIKVVNPEDTLKKFKYCFP